MTAGKTVASGIRELSQSLAGASDERIARVLAVVDALPERGAADRLVAPIRPRLAQLRPARPLRFARLLFMPLDPLIVPAPHWRPGSLTFPRTVLQPLAESVQDAMAGNALAKIEAALVGRTTADLDTVRRVGALLWPVAGRLLCTVPPARSWHLTGLSQAEHPALARAAGALLTHAVALHAMSGSPDDQPRPATEDVERLLQDAGSDGPDTVSRVLTLALDHVPQASAVLHLAETRSGLGETTGRAAAERAVSFLLDRLETGGNGGDWLRGHDLDESEGAVRQVAALLDDLEGGRAGPARKRRVAEIRQQVDASCRTRFATALDADLLEPLMGAHSGTGTEEIVALEGAARGLRRLETAARRVGGAEFYDRKLRRVASDLTSRQAGPELGLIDRVRLLEILAGPEEALALLEAETG